jgi:type VI secretion system protein ImpK
MRDELARLCHPVLAYGLDLKARLDHGETPPLEAEQATLTGLLLSEEGSRRLPDFGGDPPASAAVLAPVPALPAPRGQVIEERPAEPFLGVRYALVAWLDELFVLYSPWSNRWNEHKLEVALYASNDRAWRFWEQAKLAATRPSTDALEVFYLCVALGFRGNLSEEPERLREWQAGAQAQLTRGLSREWTGPPELRPTTNVPPRHGRERLRRLVLAASATLLLAVPATALFLILASRRW